MQAVPTWENYRKQTRSKPRRVTLAAFDEPGLWFEVVSGGSNTLADIAAIEKRFQERFTEAQAQLGETRLPFILLAQDVEKIVAWNFGPLPSDDLAVLTTIPEAVLWFIKDQIDDYTLEMIPPKYRRRLERALES